MTANLPISTDIEAMKRAEPIFQTALSNVTTSLQNMEAQQETLAINWQGETATAFGQALTTWLGDMQAVQKALTNIIDVMGHNTGVYANTQEDSSQVQQAFTSGVQGLSGLSGLQF